MSLNLEEVQQIRIPIECLDVHQQSTAGIGHVGHVIAGHLPQNPRVHCSEEQPLLGDGRSDARDLVDEPFEFERTEVRRNRKTCLAFEPIQITTRNVVQNVID